MIITKCFFLISDKTFFIIEVHNSTKHIHRPQFGNPCTTCSNCLIYENHLSDMWLAFVLFPNLVELIYHLKNTSTIRTHRMYYMIARRAV